VSTEGFDGADKVFLFEFSMPHEPVDGSFLADQPALWFLNAKIPYTMQYGACSCWATGCGEFDVFEVLAPGDTKCKSTFHSVFAGGDSNYFQRPSDAPVKVAVVFNSAGKAVSVKVLDSSVDFSQGLSQAQVDAMTAESAKAGTGALLSSLFAISS
jgi:hypothetical protein